LSAHNYLDDLDNLLDDPNASLAPAAQPKAHHESSSDTEPSSTQVQQISSVDEAHHASQTWAEVIEGASRALHEGTQLSQDATRKNIELAKEQQASIKELSDAASGWRHSTRQAVQEVNATKKNIIILTIISGLIAIAGFGTTIGVMLQSRASFVSMSNAILENVDEHQTIVSKTLTLKMDELASTIEQMQASIDQLNTAKINTAIVAAAAMVPDSDETVNNTEVAKTNDTEVTYPVQPEIIKKLVVEATPAPTVMPLTSPVIASTTPRASTEVVPATTHATAEAWQQLLTQVDQLQQQLQQIEQNAIKQAQAQNQHWQQIATQMDEKLAARLAKLPTTLSDTTKTPTSVTAVVDTKPIMDQLTRLRQEMAELRLLQQSLKEQLGQVKQTVTESANKPYQYRLPQENERYPR